MRKLTNDEQEIRQWATRNNAHPVERAPFFRDSQVAQLGFVFGTAPEANESLQPIPWSRFFAIFQLSNLVLAYDDHRDYELLHAEADDFDERFDDKPLQA